MGSTSGRTACCLQQWYWLSLAYKVNGSTVNWLHHTKTQLNHVFGLVRIQPLRKPTTSGIILSLRVEDPDTITGMYTTPLFTMSYKYIILSIAYWICNDRVRIRVVHHSKFPTTYIWHDIDCNICMLIRRFRARITSMQPMASLVSQWKTAVLHNPSPVTSLVLCPIPCTAPFKFMSSTALRI